MFHKKSDAKHGIYLPPAVGYSWSILFNLIWANKISGRYIPRLLAVIIINFINLPFRMYERLFINPRILKEPSAEAPIFIIGHWRSGTTHLHNILCQDKQMGYTTTYQSVFPDTLFNKLGRFLFSGFTRLLMPGTREGDNVSLNATYPQEEEFALGDKTPICFYYFWMFPRNLRYFYNKYILFERKNDKQVACWKNDYKLLINKSLKNTKGKIYLSKNPSNTGRIKMLLEMFPHAKFIHIHRNPIEVFLSTRKFFSQMLPHLQLQSMKDEEIDKDIFWLYKNIMGEYLDQKNNIPVGNLFEVSFEQLEENPLPVMKDLYNGLHLKGYEQAQSNFTRYLITVDQYKKNKHRISKENLDNILLEWGSIMTKLNYTVPDTIEIINE